MSDAKRVCKDVFPDVDLERPRYDQSTYLGRARHFFIITNPLNVFASSRDLENARNIVQHYRCKKPLPFCITEDELWRAKQLYDSAFHPDTGEKMSLVGRMSAQVPMNMLITSGMMAFYKGTPAVLFWQWVNQSFNAVVNYTNRSGDSPITEKQLLVSYVLATSGAVTTALSLNRLVRNAPPLVGRFVPFVAVSAANCVNIPCMRSQEIIEGTPVFDENENKIGNSKNAARSGIFQVICSRIAMASPGMMLTPFFMNHLEKKGVLKKRPWIAFPVQLGLLGVCLVFATPLACAVFKQKAEIKLTSLEPELQEKAKQMYGDGKMPTVLYYNKGL